MGDRRTGWNSLRSWQISHEAYRTLLRDAETLTLSELDRLRKIEAAARLMSDWLRDNPAAESRISMSVDSGSLVGRILLTDLRKSLETETDG